MDLRCWQRTVIKFHLKHLDVCYLILNNNLVVWIETKNWLSLLDSIRADENYKNSWQKHDIWRDIALMLNFESGK